jgi:hypothetical protein
MKLKRFTAISMLIGFMSLIAGCHWHHHDRDRRSGYYDGPYRGHAYYYPRDRYYRR